jgi:ribosomal protein L37AE/L43A
MTARDLEARDVSCFACSESATATVRRRVNGQDGAWECEVDACDEHRDPERWTPRTETLFARVARRVREVSREPVEDIAREFIEEGLD